MKKMGRLRLNNAKSINNLIARTINSLLDETISEDEARTIGYLANILYKGIEQAEQVDLRDQIIEHEDDNFIEAMISQVDEIWADHED